MDERISLLTLVEGAGHVLGQTQLDGVGGEELCGPVEDCLIDDRLFGPRLGRQATFDVVQ